MDESTPHVVLFLLIKSFLVFNPLSCWSFFCFESASRFDDVIVSPPPGTARPTPWSTSASSARWRLPEPDLRFWPGRLRPKRNKLLFRKLFLCVYFISRQQALLSGPDVRTQPEPKVNSRDQNSSTSSSRVLFTTRTDPTLPNQTVLIQLDCRIRTADWTLAMCSGRFTPANLVLVLPGLNLQNQNLLRSPLPGPSDGASVRVLQNRRLLPVGSTGPGADPEPLTGPPGGSVHVCVLSWFCLEKLGTVCWWRIRTGPVLSPGAQF